MRSPREGDRRKGEIPARLLVYTLPPGRVGLGNVSCRYVYEGVKVVGVNAPSPRAEERGKTQGKVLSAWALKWGLVGCAKRLQ